MADYIGWPWSLDLLPLCLAFMWAGQALRTSNAARRAVMHPAMLVIAAAVFAHSLGTAKVDLNLRVFEPFTLALSAALAGCVLTLAVSRGLCRFAAIARPLALVGRHTLVIFILHVSVQKALLMVFPGESLSQTGLGILGLVSAALTIAITLCVSVLIDLFRARHAAQRDATPSEVR
jgi:fucose 4-O-acetylase-like acetyltransferase